MSCSQHLTLLAVAALLLVRQAAGRERCVWATGRVVCSKNPMSVLSTEVKLYDRDEFIVDALSADDLMGVAYPDENGDFEVQGCAGDHDWLPFLPNYPEPFIKIYHYCNSGVGDEIVLPEFSLFAPDRYELPHVIHLDDY